VVAPLTRRSQRQISRWLFLAALAVYVTTAGGSLTTTDALVTFDVTRNLVEHHTVAMSGNLLGIEAERGSDGRYYSPFGIGQSLYNIPFYLSGRAAATVVHLRAKADTLPKAAVAMGQTLVVALVVQQTFRLSLLATGDLGVAAMAAITVAFGSILWPYSKFGFNQPLATVTLLLAINSTIEGVDRQRPWKLFSAGVWTGASLLTRHEMMIAVIPIAAWLLLRRKRELRIGVADLVRYGVGFAPGVAIWLALNAERFGNPVDTGLLHDPVPALGSPLLPGIAALLFSPSASVWLYSPFVVLGVAGLVTAPKGNRSVAWLFGGISLVFLLFYASLGNWLGGRSYGARYLIVVLPYLAAGWALWLMKLRAESRRGLFAAVVAVGVILQIPGVMLDYAKVSQSAAYAEGAFSTSERQWNWRASPLVMNTRVLGTRVSENMQYLAGTRPVPAVEAPQSDEDRGFSQQFAFSLDFWWLYLFYFGALSRTAVLVLAGLLVTGAIVALAKLGGAIGSLRQPLAADGP
jgi:hypothetical protein